MRIGVTIEKHETITLTYKQCRDITVDSLLKFYELPKNFVVKKDNIYNRVEYGGSHSHEVDEWVRSVTKIDRIAIQVIDSIRKS